MVVDLHKQWRRQKRQQMTTATANKTNDAIMKEYFEAMQTEINPSVNYVKTNRILIRLNYWISIVTNPLLK